MKLIFLFAIVLGSVFNAADLPAVIPYQEVQKINKELSIKSKVDSSVVYQTENLIIKKISDHVYVHISYLNTDDFGKVSCNGMLVINKGQGVIFDSPANDKSSMELIQFMHHKLNCKITALIPTHFHKDCIGGLEEFERHNIPTYASKQTIALLKENGIELPHPINSFNNKLVLKIGNKKVYTEYFGEGHTKDNVVGYFPTDNVIFGGCLIKEIGAGKGNLADANSNQWSTTVEKLKSKHPDAKIIIPGHGQWGGTDLLDYTIKLFRTKI